MYTVDRIQLLLLVYKNMNRGHSSSAWGNIAAGYQTELVAGITGAACTDH